MIDACVAIMPTSSGEEPSPGSDSWPPGRHNPEVGIRSQPVEKRLVSSSKPGSILYSCQIAWSPGAHGVTDARSAEGTLSRSLGAGLAGGPGSSWSLLPGPGSQIGFGLRARARSRSLRGHRATIHRPSGFLQASTHHVLRGHPLGATVDRGGPPEPGAPVVSRLPLR